MRRRPPSAQATASRVMREENRRTREAPRAQHSRPAVWPLREVAFSFYGEIEPSLSPRWSHPDGALLVEVLLQLDGPGSTDTTVAVRLNGSTNVVVETIPAGGTRASWSALDEGVDLEDEGIDLDPSDFIQAVCVDAGEGAVSLTVQVRFA